jgi:drug/metabolite transporter (DMT)-like permease
MIWLIGASLIWGLSFGLIKGLASGLDPFTLGLYRSVIAAFVFAPWLRIRGVQERQDMGSAFVCGFVQIGLMYGPYLKSFHYLKSYEVALFTMTTPLIAGLLLKASERTSWRRLLSALSLATVGGLIAAWHDITSETWLRGVLMVQVSNALFALGSLLWARRFPRESKASIGVQARLMTPYFLGASWASGLLTMIFSSPLPHPQNLSQQQILVIIWLGVMASGVGFFMWNRGVSAVQAASLAVANNLKIPLAILLSIVVFGESANLATLIPGLAMIILALRVADGMPRTK